MLNAIGRVTADNFSDSNEVKLIREDCDLSVGEHHEDALKVITVLHLDMQQGQFVLKP